MKSKTHEKKHKHEKLKKKSKKRRKETSSSSSSSSSSSKEDSSSEKEEWVESKKKPQRDNWMNDDDNNEEFNFIPTYSKVGGERKRERLRKTAEEKLKEKKLLEERELNPYWKNDGCGLPLKRPDDSPENKLPSQSVGDGGYSWLKKAYDRVKEQAKTEGRSMEDVAVERWGSLEVLEKRLNEARKQVKGYSRSPSPKSYDKNKYDNKDTYSSSSTYPKKKNDYERDSYDRSSKSSYSSSKTDRYDRDKRSSRSFIPPNDDDDYPSSKKSDYRGSSSTSHRPSWKKESRKSPDRHYRPSSHQPSWKKESKRSPDRHYHRPSSPSSDQPAWKKDNRKSDEKHNQSSSSHCPSWKKESRRESPDQIYDRSSSPSSHRPAWKKESEKHRRDSTPPRETSWRKDSTQESEKCKSPELSSSHPAWKTNQFQKESHNLNQRFSKEGTEMPEKEVSKGETTEMRNKRLAKEEEEENTDEESESDTEKDELEKKRDSMRDCIMNRNELNLLSARAIQAEFCADFQLAEQILKDLDKAKTARKDFESSGAKVYDGQPRDEVVDCLVDSYALPKKLQQFLNHSKRRKVINIGPLQKQYFDDKLSLKEMFQKEKMLTSDDQLKMFVNTAAACKNSVNEDFADDVSGKVSKKMEHYPSEEKDIKKAMQDHKRHSSALEKCRYCLDKPLLLKHTIVAKGNHVFICVPQYTSLVEGHCMIIPKSHVSSSLLLEEEEFNELQVFKRGLTTVFNEKGEDIIFLETSTHYRYFPHAVIECIPVPKETADMAPMYFKKAIDECETEWSHNKKLIDLSKKGLRHSVPKGLQFFSVEFSYGGGFAHVIEDERNFPKHFGKEIVGGMLEIDSHHILKAKDESLKDLYKKTLTFSNLWWKYKNFFEC